MAKESIGGKTAAVCLSAVILAICPGARAIEIVSGPGFTPAANAPLAGNLQLTTDTGSRICVLVSDGTDFWERNFYDFATNHSVPLAGFKPGRTNLIQVIVYDKDQNAYTAGQMLTFITPPLPADFPTSVILTNNPSQMEPGYTLFIIANRTTSNGYITIMDNSGEVVWYAPSPQYSASDVRQLDDGNLLIEESPPGNQFVEMNLLGQTVSTLYPPSGYAINTHEALPTSRGTLLYLSDVTEAVPNFPTILPRNSTNENPPLATVDIDDNPVVEISTNNGALLNVWSPLAMLDPTRVTYFTGDYLTSYGLDNIHANAIIEDTNDDSIIVSLRDQCAVYKFSRSSGQLKWILGPPEGWGAAWQQYLFTPTGTPFDWNYGQHAPSITPEGTLLLYNDGAYRAMPFAPYVPDQSNYSSAEEFQINETNQEVSEIWNSAWQTNQDRLFTPIVGKAQWLSQTRNILVTYGYIHFVNGVAPSPSSPDATMVRIIEYTHDPVPQVVSDLSFWDYDDTEPFYYGYFCYRATWIPDLYAHPLEPVYDLCMRAGNNMPLLEFSADPTHSYVVQASTNLINWTTIGTPVQEGDAGDFIFEDLNGYTFTTRFYRVLSQ
jgi:arylsulfate sulfotransferase